MKNYIQLAEAFSRWENGEVPLFNGDISGWNGDSSGWDGDSVTDMSGMFAGATDLSRWENDMQALDESIDHWERLKDALERGDLEGAMSEGWHADQCALCSVFAVTEHGKYFLAYCNGCPVSVATGRTGCEGTPYRKAAERLYDWRYMTPMPSKIREQYRMKALDAVNEELEFLRSLRRTK